MIIGLSHFLSQSIKIIVFGYQGVDIRASVAAENF